MEKHRQLAHIANWETEIILFYCENDFWIFKRVREEIDLLDKENLKK